MVMLLKKYKKNSGDKVMSFRVFIAFFCMLVVSACVSHMDVDSVSNGAKGSQFLVRGVPFRIDVKLAAAVQGDDKFKHGIYFYDIHCGDISCWVDLIVLNECEKNKNGTVEFYPRLKSWADSGGFLNAKKLSDTEIEITVFQFTHHGFPAKINLAFFDEEKPPYFKRLKSFSVTNLLDVEKLPDEFSFFNLEAIPSSQLKQLDCPVFLPGIQQ
jgi:hypothetical protein